MRLTPLLAMIRKDLRLFVTDRRALLMSFVAPIAMASFLGTMFPGPRGAGQPVLIPVHVVVEDGSGVAGAIVRALRESTQLAITMQGAERARLAVQSGNAVAAIVIPAGFGDRATTALLTGRDRPEIELLYDPSHRAELALLRGMLAEHVITALASETFQGPAALTSISAALDRLGADVLTTEDRRALRRLLTALQTASRPGGAPRSGTPYALHETPVGARANVAYNGYAHSFAGMGVQFLLFAAIDLGVGILLERQRGLWKRVRSAPISRLTLIAGKTASGIVIALLTLLVSFGFAMLVFGVRIHGSVLGFFGVAVSCAVMASTFGVFVAALGHTPGTTRGIALLAVLVMVMLGGAWIPTFLFPAWLQQLTVVVPVRWALDGLDAMTWRGLGLSGAVVPTIMLLAFSTVFAFLAVRLFRWEE